MKDIQQLKEEFDKLGKADNLGMVKFYEPTLSIVLMLVKIIVIMTLSYAYKVNMVSA